MKPIVTWVVTADSGRVRILQNLGPGKGLTPVEDGTLTDQHRYARDTESDRLGRSHASVGASRSAIEPHTDPVVHEEEAFARRIADLLAAKLATHAYDRLILAAEPVALGNIRAALSPGVSRTVSAELPKDLAQVPLAELPNHLEGLLAI